MTIVDRTRKVHFVGIGGSGMSGIAEILCRSGHTVTGSDLNESETISRLRELGAEVQIGHSEKILKKVKPDVLVFSTAVSRDNPELVYARGMKIPLIRRAEMLGELMRLRRGIAVAGSHGKTTTTGLLSLILREGDLDPTVVIGGRFNAIGSNAKWGEGPWLVAEADESDGSFNRLTPEMAIVTNIDREHLNHYGSFEATLDAFEDFLDRLPFYGKAVLCSDCPHVRSVIKTLNKSFVTYGFEEEHGPDFLVRITENSATPKFTIEMSSEETSTASLEEVEFQLSVPGRHNVLNASAAAVMGLSLGVSVEKIAAALRSFSGVSRRFEVRGNWQCGTLVEDYAHHPTEIRATIEAALTSFKKAPVIVFQPHRYSRTRELWDDFSTCFEGAHKVFTLPIFAASEARELWGDDFDGVYFARNIKNADAEFVEDFALAKEKINEQFSGNDRPLLVLGAGNIAKLIPELLK